MGRRLLLFTILCCVLHEETALDTVQKRLSVKRLEPCRGTKDMPLLFHNLITTRDPKTGEMSMDMDIDAKEVISKNLAIVLSLSKCDTSGNPDSCEYAVKDYNATNVCELMEMENEAWTDFLKKIHPPLVCPIQVGRYHLTNMLVSKKMLEYLPVSDAVWKVHLVGWDTGKIISCVEFEEQIQSVYNRKSKG